MFIKISTIAILLLFVFKITGIFTCSWWVIILPILAAIILKIFIMFLLSRLGYSEN